jgi:predicted enzyme related to lactoylglutathione lyase
MFRGFATISFYADDLAAAADWYTDLLGAKPYYVFPQPPAPPAYLEFRVGDDEDELGFIDRRYAPPGAAGAPGGAVTYWHVDDLAGTVRRLLAMGATEYQPITHHGDGEGFVTASVVDPFGNVLGVMHNPHYLEIRA